MKIGPTRSLVSSAEKAMWQCSFLFPIVLHYFECPIRSQTFGLLKGSSVRFDFLRHVVAENKKHAWECRRVKRCLSTSLVLKNTWAYYSWSVVSSTLERAHDREPWIVWTNSLHEFFDEEKLWRRNRFRNQRSVLSDRHVGPSIWN